MSKAFDLTLKTILSHNVGLFFNDLLKETFTAGQKEILFGENATIEAAMKMMDKDSSGNVITINAILMVTSFLTLHNMPVTWKMQYLYCDTVTYN